MILANYLGITANNYPQFIHEVSNIKNDIAVTAVLREGVSGADACELQYNIIPPSERIGLTVATWVSSPVGYIDKDFVQYSVKDTPISSVRLHPLSGTWDMVVREIKTDTSTLQDAKF